MFKQVCNVTAVMSRVVTELVHDPDARMLIQRVIAHQQRANDEDHERLSERDLKRMICASIAREQPHLSPSAVERLFVRRWEAAMRPYAGPLPSTQRSPTARDLYRAERKAMVKRGKEGRR